MLSVIADENFNRRMLRGLKLRNGRLDAIVAQNAGLCGARDPVLLAWAAQAESRDDPFIYRHCLQETRHPRVQKDWRQGWTSVGCRIAGREIDHMQKRITGSSSQDASLSDGRWLDLGSLAQVEVTSEDPKFPIEFALIPGSGPNWRASEPGEQSIVLKFNEPQRLTRTRLRFVEPEVERTQEFAVSWSTDGGRSFREIVRQQWNFSPSGSTSESEDYQVDLSAVSALKLTINPDLGRGKAAATLSEWRLA